jgi:hypothetical protein
MGDYQNGFRDGRSVIDNIFALRIINKKPWEYNQSVQYLFIDFQKAYDSIHRGITNDIRDISQTQNLLLSTRSSE